MSEQDANERWDDQTTRFVFGDDPPWWARRKWLRRVFHIPLRVVDRNFLRWSKSRVSRRKFKRIQDMLEREYPSSKFARERLVGREKEYNLLLDAFRLHVLRHPLLRDWFTKDELPKAICLTGESGTGKTFLTMVTMRQMLMEAHRSGVLVSPIIVKGSDVFSEFYGRSTKQLGKILEQAVSIPSVVYIDEFQSFGRKVRGDTGTEVEDTRVQDELNRWLDKILTGRSRTLVIVATNAYEATREDIRRRLARVDLDSGVTREMILALICDALEREGWDGASAREILEVLEREATIRRRGSITPNDVQSVFREVRKAKEIPILEVVRRGIASSFSILPRPKYKVSLEDFVAAAKSMKFYSDQEKSREVMDSVYLMKPKEGREDIGGLHDLKDKVLNHIALAFNPKMNELGYDSNCRFLLLGPPGTGKTLIALVAAAENDVNFIRVRGGELMSGAAFIGDPEKRIRELFSLARQKSPCILFLDEADAIFWGGDPTSNKVLAQIKAELSELKSQDRIVVIAASNKEELIDRATRDRFEPNIYYVHPPLNDAEWNEVVEIHLRKIRDHLHPEVCAAPVTKMLRRQRNVSPRGVAETISEAHRLWASELSALAELDAARNPASAETTRKKYKDDLQRLDEVLAEYHREGKRLSHVDPSNYKVRLSHFERAIGSLERTDDVEKRELSESLIMEKPASGVAQALFATDEGSGGVLTVQCSIRPLIRGEPHVSVTGQAVASLLGQTSVPDQSVVQSAKNATEAVRSWLWERAKVPLRDYHVHFQIRSIFEGVPGQGVSGPSAGLAMFCALVSELAGVAVSSSKVMTGTIGVKLDVGPVGGLGGFGTQTGKLVGVLKTQRVRISDLVLPKINYEKARDEIRVLEEEGVSVHPVILASEALEILLGLDEDQLIRAIRCRLEEQASAFSRVTPVQSRRKKKEAATIPQMSSLRASLRPL